MTVRVYKSSDAGAPSIGRSLGSLITLLDACLVNGYGAKASLGWTKEFSGTNKAVYRMAEGTRMYMRLQDDQHVDYIGGANWYFGFEATGVDTLLRKFNPSNTLYMHKPDTVAAGGKWMLVGDGSRFWLFTTRDGWGGAYSTTFFGDLISCAANPAADVGKAVLLASNGIHTGQTRASNAEYLYYTYNPNPTAFPGHHLVGDTKGGCNEPTGINVGKSMAIPFLDNVMRYPSTIHGGVACSPLYIITAINTISNGNDLRGVLPGMYFPYAIKGLFTPQDGAQFTYTQGGMAGRVLEAVRILDSTTTDYMVVLVEVSDTWGS